MSERKFKVPTIKVLKEAGLNPSNLERLQYDWDMMIKFWNACLESGDPITENTPLTELKDIQEEFGKYFL